MHNYLNVSIIFTLLYKNSKVINPVNKKLTQIKHYFSTQSCLLIGIGSWCNNYIYGSWNICCPLLCWRQLYISIH